MIKKYLGLVALVGLLLCSILAGCSNQGNQGNSAVAKDMSKLTGMIGLSEQSLKDQLGDGEMIMDDATGLAIARNYTLDLFGEQLETSAFLDGERNVSGVTVILPDNDFVAWQKQLTEVYGKPSETNADNGSEGNGLQEAIWNTDNTIISVKTVFGVLSIEIFPLS